MIVPDFTGVCVVLPAYNEAQHIEACLRSVWAAFPNARVLVVDNNSQDQTGAIARLMGATVLHEPRAGKGYAVVTGVQHALTEDCEWVVFHDADNEYDARHVARLVLSCQLEASEPNEAPAGKASVEYPHAPPGPPDVEPKVQAWIMGVGLRQVTLAHVLWRSVLANFVANLALRLSLRRTPPADILTGSRVLSADLARHLFEDEQGKAPYTGFELETAITRKAMMAKAQIVCRSVRYEPRQASQKKIKPWDLWRIVKAAWGVEGPR